MVEGRHVDECGELSLNLKGLDVRIALGLAPIAASPDGTKRFAAPEFVPSGLPGDKNGRPGKCFDEDGRYGPR
jgi:hypothetical protein